jgi:hypothetical protein
MKSFSERKGIEPPKVVQSNDMDQPLRIKLWSVFYDHFFGRWSETIEGLRWCRSPLAEFVSDQLRWLWVNLLHNTSDSYPDDEQCVPCLRQVFLGNRWDKVYSYQPQMTS